MEPEFRFVDQYEGTSPSSSSSSSGDTPNTANTTSAAAAAHDDAEADTKSMPLPPTRIAPPLPPCEDAPVNDVNDNDDEAAEWRPRPHRWLLDASVCVFALADAEVTAPADEFKERVVAAAHIQRLCRALKIVDWTASTAIVLMHRYLAYRTLPLHNKFIVSTTCVHVAGKVEETPKRITDILPTAYAMWHGDAKPLHRKSKRYKSLLIDVLLCERLLLSTILFEYDIEHPYRYVQSLAKSIVLDEDRDNDPAQLELLKRVVQAAWQLVTDSLRGTMLCLQFSARFVAGAAVQMAASLCMVGVSPEQPPSSFVNAEWARRWDIDAAAIKSAIEQIVDVYDDAQIDTLCERYPLHAALLRRRRVGAFAVLLRDGLSAQVRQRLTELSARDAQALKQLANARPPTPPPPPVKKIETTTASKLALRSGGSYDPHAPTDDRDRRPAQDRYQPHHSASVSSTASTPSTHYHAQSSHTSSHTAYNYNQSQQSWQQYQQVYQQPQAHLQQLPAVRQWEVHPSSALPTTGQPSDLRRSLSGRARPFSQTLPTPVVVPSFAVGVPPPQQQQQQQQQQSDRDRRWSPPPASNGANGSADTNKRARVSNQTCFHCHQTGHVRAQCPQRLQQPQQPQQLQQQQQQHQQPPMPQQQHGRGRALPPPNVSNMQVTYPRNRVLPPLRRDRY